MNILGDKKHCPYLTLVMLIFLIFTLTSTAFASPLLTLTDDFMITIQTDN